MKENNRQTPSPKFEKPSYTVDFQKILQKTLLNYGIEKVVKPLLFFNDKESLYYFSVDIAPNGLFDTQLVKKIIREFKPDHISYVKGSGDDWGNDEYLTIPTEKKDIKLRAHVYVFDQNGGVWSKFNDPSSDGYRKIPNPQTDYRNLIGRYELIRK